MQGHFGDFVRWSKARKKINNAKFAEMIGVSDKTVTNILTYETHERLDDGVVSEIALVLGYRNEIEFIEAYRRGIPDFGSVAGIITGADLAKQLPAAASMSPPARAAADKKRKPQ